MHARKYSIILFLIFIKLYLDIGSVMAITLLNQCKFNIYMYCCKYLQLIHSFLVVHNLPWCVSTTIYLSILCQSLFSPFPDFCCQKNCHCEYSFIYLLDKM